MGSRAGALASHESKRCAGARSRRAGSRFPRHASCSRASGGAHTMTNPQIVDGAARRPVSQDTVSQDTMSHGRSALLRVATVVMALAARPVSAQAPPLQFVRRDIDQGVFAQVTEGINVGDIDGDGRPDIVVGGDAYLVWFHNPDWAPNLIASGFKFAGGAMVVVRDMDGDGRLDVMTGR